MRDKRANFFALAAVACFALVPLAEDKYREVTLGVAIVYVLLSVASLLDFRSKR